MRKEYSIEFKKRIIAYYCENNLSCVRVAEYFNIPYRSAQGIILKHKKNKPIVAAGPYGPAPTVIYKTSSGEVYGATRLMNEIGSCRTTARLRILRICKGEMTEEDFFKRPYF